MVPSWVVRVNVPIPTDLTVPTAAGGVPPGPPGPPGPPVGGAPTATLVAVTVLEVSVPNTATWAPTVTLPKEGEVMSWSR